jgi:hypothetical protein
MKNTIFLIIIGLITLNQLRAQEFQYKGNNLFGLEFTTIDSSRSAIKTLFYDLDLDGDFDAIMVGIDKIDSVKNITFNNIHYFIDMQENIGDRWHPSFKTRKPFMNNFPYPNGYFFPALGDLNHDRMADFIVSAGVDSFLNLEPLYYRRKSNIGDDQFEIKGVDFLGLDYIPSGSFLIPDIGDMDMDGDLDLLMSGFVVEIDDSGDRFNKPLFLYAKNTGTITQPKFEGWYPNPYGLINTIDQNQLSIIGDIDNDNDNDILSLTSVDTFKIFYFFSEQPFAKWKT